jgi:sulfur carrier protein
MERYDACMSSPSPPQPGDAGASIEIRVNGRAERAPAGCTVAQLLEHLDLHPDQDGKRVAIAIDREVVPRSRWTEFTLAPGARVEILEAVGGG